MWGNKVGDFFFFFYQEVEPGIIYGADQLGEMVLSTNISQSTSPVLSLKLLRAHRCDTLHNEKIRPCNLEPGIVYVSLLSRLWLIFSKELRCWVEGRCQVKNGNRQRAWNTHWQHHTSTPLGIGLQRSWSCSILLLGHVDRLRMDRYNIRCWSTERCRAMTAFALYVSCWSRGFSIFLVAIIIMQFMAKQRKHEIVITVVYFVLCLLAFFTCPPLQEVKQKSLTKSKNKKWCFVSSSYLAR